MDHFETPQTPPDPGPAWGDSLPPGTRLEYFEVERVLWVSSFGVVYLASDHALGHAVAIKEYLPTTLATRRNGVQVVLRGESHGDAFMRGRDAFVEEARALARCDHPALLRVSRLLEAHGTVYRVMPYLSGQSLQALRQAIKQPPDEGWLRSLLDALLGALATLHNAGVVHGRVAPGNILMRPDGRPVLMDFDAVRKTLVSDTAQSLMAALEPSFAAVPRPAGLGGAASTPADDLHALAALAYFCITGQTPAAAGAGQPAFEPLSQAVARLGASVPHLNFKPSFLAAIDAALSPDAGERPRHVAEFRAALDRPDPRPAAVAKPPAPEPMVESERTVAFEPIEPEPAVALPSAARDEERAFVFPRIEPSAKPPVGPAAPPPAPISLSSLNVPDPREPRLEGASGSPLFGSGLTWREASDPAFDGAAADAKKGPGATPPWKRARRSWYERMLPWGVAALLVATMAGAVWKFNEQRTTDGVLSELARPGGKDADQAAARSKQADAKTAAALAQAEAALAIADPPPGAASEPASGTADAEASVSQSPPGAGVSAAAQSESASAPMPSAPQAAAPVEERAAAPARPATRSPARVVAAEPEPEPERQARAASNPREVCGERTEFSLYRCMQTQCSQAQWRQHAQCTRLRVLDRVDG